MSCTLRDETDITILNVFFFFVLPNSDQTVAAGYC